MSTDRTYVNRFKAEYPDLKIRGKVRNGTDRRTFATKKRDATRAIPNDACHCTMANGMLREFGLPALFLDTVAYLLEPSGDGWHSVTKYEHDGAPVAKALDASGVAVWNTTVTLRPPSRYRRAGAQTQAQKDALPGARTQTRAHVAKRAAGIRKAAGIRARRKVAAA